jgi:hypothetical protein
MTKDNNRLGDGFQDDEYDFEDRFDDSFETNDELAFGNELDAAEDGDEVDDDYD